MSARFALFRMTWLRLLLMIFQLYLCLLLYTRSASSVLPVMSTEKKATTTRATTDEQDKLPLPNLQVCHTSSFAIPNQPFRFELEYQCSGPLYDNFSSWLAAFEADAGRHGPTWGRRQRVLPPNATVLFLGNSHTKQTHNQLACQYADSLIGFEGLHHAVGGTIAHKNSSNNHTGTSVSDYTSYLLRFQDGVSVYLVYNSPVEIARDWQRRLESIVRRPLASFDAVVLGQFNGAGKDIRNTSYYRRMKNWTLLEEGGGSGGALGPGRGQGVEPPDVIRLAAAYRGPIVFVSNYDVGKAAPAAKILQVMEEISASSRRSNLVGITSRRYISDLGGNECGTDVRVTRTSTAPDCGVRHSRSHRCVGKAGGHPSLIAHDVQEALFSVLGGR
jgi:hypothetical protein